MKHLHTFIHIIINLIFPHACVGCKKDGELLCAICAKNISPTRISVSPGIIACFPYHEPRIKTLLWQLKYHHTYDVANILAPHAHKVLQTLNPTHMPIILVPVPSSKRRKRKRGFNQAEILAQAIAQLAPERIQCDTTLVQKHKHTKPQVVCRSRRERQNNLTGAFGSGPSSPTPHMHYIIIDDVTTTGTTLIEIMNVLQNQGAHHVTGFAIAHG